MDIKTFSDLKTLIQSKKIHSLPKEEFRLPVDQYIYEEYCKLINRQTALDLLTKEIEYNRVHSKFSITKNRFGYTKLLKDLPLVQHLNLWYNKGITEEEIKEYLANIYDLQNIIVHESLQQNKSVPEIEHKHIFLLLE